VDFAQLKSEIQLVEKNDLAQMKAENDRLMTDIEKLKQRLREEITRTQAGVRLDLNLEKGPSVLP
jgi:regulator of replication initiation timing